MRTFKIVMTYTTTGTEDAEFYKDRILAWPVDHYFTGNDELDALRIDGAVPFPIDEDQALALSKM